MIKQVIYSAIGALSLTSICLAASAPSCPSVDEMQTVTINYADPTDDGYLAYYDGFLNLGTQMPWMVAVGNFDADSVDDAKKVGQEAMNAITMSLSETAFEDSDDGMWLCMYPTNDPTVLAIALSPMFDENATLRATKTALPLDAAKRHLKR